MLISNHSFQTCSGHELDMFLKKIQQKLINKKTGIFQLIESTQFNRNIKRERTRNNFRK